MRFVNRLSVRTALRRFTDAPKKDVAPRHAA